MNKLETIIDRHLQWLIDNDINKQPAKVEKEMSEPGQDPKEEWRIWYPVKSTISDTEMQVFEQSIGHALPDSYKEFLRHKHFYELYIGEASFGKHPVNVWQQHQRDRIFDGYPREFLIDKGYIPFADWHDWGLLCFDTTKGNGTNYPIVLWDHEVFDEVELFARDFESLILQLDEESERN